MSLFPHSEEHGETEPGLVGRRHSLIYDSYLAEPGSPATETGMSEGLFGFTKRK